MKLTRLALTGALLGALLAADTAAFADPDAVAAAKAKLDAIAAEVSAIEQEGIEAGALAEEAKQRLARTEQDLQAQESKVAKMSDELGQLAVLQLQQSNLDVTLQLLSSATDDSFLSAMGAVQAEAERSNTALQQLQNDQARLDVLRAEAKEAKEAIDANVATKAARLKEYEAKQAEAERIYNQLKQEERERLAQLQAEQERRAAAAAPATSRSEARAAVGAAPQAAESSEPAEPVEEAPVAAPDGSRAQTVINAALAQVGKRYVYGTSGPNTFDCSGLTSYAYRQIGISLPRTSRAQYASAGRKVSVSDIQPGDLVFYYSGPSHVGIYIGNGKIVHAANPRSGVNVTGLYSMPLKGVRRVL